MKKTNSTIISLAVLFLFSLSACSSYFKRKECENINWYDYGYKVAMSGKRLSNDNYILECKKVEAELSESQLDLGFKAGMSNYCKPETVLATGKKGEFFNSDFCDPGQAKMLTQKHQEGVLLFCEAKNGYSFGASGSSYNQICPKNLEPLFLVEYKKGRKKFLNQSILENEQRILKLNQDSHRVTQERTRVEYELRTIETVQLVKNHPQTSQNQNQQVDPIESKRRDLNSKINNLSTELRSLENQKNKSQEEIYQWKKEILTLED